MKIYLNNLKKILLGISFLIFLNLNLFSMQETSQLIDNSYYQNIIKNAQLIKFLGFLINQIKYEIFNKLADEKFFDTIQFILFFNNQELIILVCKDIQDKENKKLFYIFNKTLFSKKVKRSLIIPEDSVIEDLTKSESFCRLANLILGLE